MLKQTVQYEDFNDQPKSQDLYFHLSKTEMMDLVDLLPRLEAFAAATTGEERELTTPEVKEMLSLVKALIKAAYGERVDADHFRKSPEIYANFENSAVYDAFVFGLFEDLDKANKFMIGILPKGLNQVTESTGVVSVNLPEAEKQEINRTVPKIVSSKTASELRAVDQEVPAYVREDREPTAKELAAMSRDELADAFKRKSQKTD